MISRLPAALICRPRNHSAFNGNRQKNAPSQALRKKLSECVAGTGGRQFPLSRSGRQCVTLRFHIRAALFFSLTHLFAFESDRSNQRLEQAAESKPLLTDFGPISPHTPQWSGEVRHRVVHQVARECPFCRKLGACSMGISRRKVKIFCGRQDFP